MRAKRVKKHGTASIKAIAALSVIAVAVLSILLISMFSGCGRLKAVGGGKVDTSGEDLIGRDDEISAKDDRGLKKKPGVYTFVVGGSSNFALADTIALVYFEPKENIVNIMQIPRDTYVTYTGGSSKKINSSFAYKGGDGLIKSVRHTFGVEADGYAVIGTKALREAVDAIGGVMVDVPMDMFYEDPVQDLYINLKKGTQVLDGNKAEQFVRFRKGYADQDIGRMEAQRKFVAAFADKLLSLNGVTKIPSLTNTVFKNLRTDLTAAQIINCATKGLSVKSSNIKVYRMPGETTKNGIYVSIYANETLELINAHFNPYTTELTKKDLNIKELSRTYADDYDQKVSDFEQIKNSGQEYYVNDGYTAKDGEKQVAATKNTGDAVKPAKAEQSTKTVKSKGKIYMRYCIDAAKASKIASQLTSAGFEVDADKLAISFDKTKVYYTGSSPNIDIVKQQLPTADYSSKSVKTGYDYELFIGNDMK